MSNPIHILLLLVPVACFVLPAILVARLADRDSHHLSTGLFFTTMLLSWALIDRTVSNAE